MNKEKYTPEGLPKLSQIVLEVLDRDMSRREDEGSESKVNWGRDIMERMKKDNPIYYEMCEGASVNYQSVQDELERRSHLGYLLGLLKGYEALRIQAEVNKIDI